VTFPAFEWHGDRTRWGDHNVLYFEEGEPLDDEWELPDLYENLRGRRALALPHHTGYAVGNRGETGTSTTPSCRRSQRSTPATGRARGSRRRSR